MSSKMFSHRQAAAFYDRLGAGLDTQAFYEAAALRELTEHLDLGTSRAVVEFGCGTGRLAAVLFESHLSPGATYLGLDVSGVMVGLTKHRLSRWGGRAVVRQCDGTPRIEALENTFDRVICTYVLDLLSDDEICAVLDEAHRVLKPGGLLGLTTLTNGPTTISHLVSETWRLLHQLSPWLVGGCRPIVLSAPMSNSKWIVDHTNVVVRFGVPSEIVVARRAPVTRSSAS